MKRIIIIIILLLIVGYLTSCTADQYTIEREYWKAQKLAERIFKNPHASPPRQLEKVVSKLRDFANKYSKNNLATNAEFTIARLYIVKEEYKKARVYLSGLVDKYKDNKEIAANALFLIGNSHEIEGKWIQALSQYKQIIKDYPLSLRGLDIPIYIAQHYKVKNQPDKMLAAFHEAASHYMSLAANHPDSPVGFNAYTLTSKCYLELKDWRSAIKIFDIIIADYKDKVKLDLLLLNKARIYQKELKENDRAKETLLELVNTYPDSSFVEPAKKLLNEIGGAK